MKEKIGRPCEDRTNHKLAYTLLQLLVMIKKIGNDRYSVYLFSISLTLPPYFLLDFFPSTHHFCSFFIHSSSPFTHSTYICSSCILPYIFFSHSSSSSFSPGVICRICWEIQNVLPSELRIHSLNGLVVGTHMYPLVRTYLLSVKYKTCCWANLIHSSFCCIVFSSLLFHVRAFSVLCIYFCNILSL